MAQISPRIILTVADISRYRISYCDTTHDFDGSDNRRWYGGILLSLVLRLQTTRIGGPPS